MEEALPWEKSLWLSPARGHTIFGFCLWVTLHLTRYSKHPYLVEHGPYPSDNPNANTGTPQVLPPWNANEAQNGGWCCSQPRCSSPTSSQNSLGGILIFVSLGLKMLAKCWEGGVKRGLRYIAYVHIRGSQEETRPHPFSHSLFSYNCRFTCRHKNWNTEVLLPFLHDYRTISQPGNRQDTIRPP